jgi:hypothetical protein
LEPILNRPPGFTSEREPLERLLNENVDLEDRENLMETTAANQIRPLKTRSIHRFIPVLEESDILGKLRMVVRQELTESLV